MATSGMTPRSLPGKTSGMFKPSEIERRFRSADWLVSEIGVTRELELELVSASKLRMRSSAGWRPLPVGHVGVGRRHVRQPTGRRNNAARLFGEAVVCVYRPVSPVGVQVVVDRPTSCRWC